MYGRKVTFKSQPTSMRELFSGMGMSSRPAYYSGYLASSTEFKTDRLVAMYRAVQAGEEAKVFPEGASEAFLRMLMSVESICTTPLMQQFFQLERGGWTWPDHPGSSPGNIAMDKTGGGGSEYSPRDLAGGMAGLFTALSNRETPEQTTAVTLQAKRVFLSRHGGINRPDLAAKLPAGAADQWTYSGTTFTRSGWAGPYSEEE
jgi:hypothetical protein